MEITSIAVRFNTFDGVARRLAADHRTHAPACEAASADLRLSISFEYAADEIIARARVTNLSDVTIRLESVSIDVATGFAADRPARFFKHGYQSWSSSGAETVGATRTHRYDRASAITRINHQSETVRSDEVPEAATSEWFTIVEADGSAERVFVGFLGAAHALSTMTVFAPDNICARAILDAVDLAPGATREIEPLLAAISGESASRMAWRWAAKMGAAMRARTSAPYQRGWCSWYQYFHTITEDAVRANLSALAAMRAEFPVEVVQLDDGFQSALGDWDSTNAKFPGGLRRLADAIRAAGFTPGIWTAPFLAARDSHLMRTHPDWFIRHQSGEPLRAGYNPNWTSHEDKYAYALDPSHPDFAAHLERLFAKLVHEFGYTYLKLDFLYAGAAQGARYDRGMTRAEQIRNGLMAIRRGAGEAAFLLGCGCPLASGVGLVDGMRIGPDVAPFWGSEGSGDPSTAYALDAIIARSFMHRQLWLNDPDCLMLRGKETGLNAEEREALAATIAASGGMLLVSDDMALIGADEARTYRAAADLGAEIDSGSIHTPILASDLMASSPLKAIWKEAADEKIGAILNRGDSPARASLEAFAHVSGKAATFTITGTPQAEGAQIELPAHSARIVRFRR